MEQVARHDHLGWLERGQQVAESFGQVLALAQGKLQLRRCVPADVEVGDHQRVLAGEVDRSLAELCVHRTRVRRPRPSGLRWDAASAAER